MLTKTCRRCGVERPTSDYRKITRNGEPKLRSPCKPCDRARERERLSDPSQKERQREWVKDRRQNPDKRAQIILEDSRKSDRRAGMVFDLKLADINAIITAPCLYCGDDQCFKTIDRIDNSIGHVKSNVVSACYRCNMVRGNMPFDAWMEMASGMRAAREKGLFGDWASGPKSKK